MPISRLTRLGLPWLVFALLAVFPLFDLTFSSNLKAILTTAFIVGFMGFGWNVVSGFIGYLSLGDYVYYALGAYGSAYAIAKLNLSPFLGLLLAVLVILVVTGILSALATRLAFRGLYYALMTLAVAAIGAIALTDIPAFGSYAGLYLPIRDDPAELLFRNLQAPYYLNLVVFALGAVVALLLFRSRTGEQMRALRDDEIAAKTLGIPLRRRLWQASAISGLYFAIGGMLSGVEAFFVSPSTTISLNNVVEVLVVVMIGGLGTVWAPLTGTVVVAAVQFAIDQAGITSTVGSQIVVIVQAFIVLTVVVVRDRGRQLGRLLAVDSWLPGLTRRTTQPQPK